MITYITDTSGKTHAYPKDRYCVNISNKKATVVKIMEDAPNAFHWPVVGEFYEIVGWWVADPKELDQ